MEVSAEVIRGAAVEPWYQVLARAACLRGLGTPKAGAIGSSPAKEVALGLTRHSPWLGATPDQIDRERARLTGVVRLDALVLL